ncbi:MAG: type II secretion system F family protein [Thermodesulfovibrionia bacterium]|nr:type II secretion system F family protein [Thermodesulfovibrionia bacterium]
MHINESYMQFAYKYFGKMSEYYFMKTFEDMKTDLRKAGINVTVSEYISVSLATSALVFAISTPLFAVISTLFVGNMEAITTGQAYILGLLMGLLGGVFSATLIFLFFHSYPSLIIGERKKKISDSLPFATLYLTTVAGSGTPPIAMFKALSSFSEYGEIAKESKRISEETEIMGVNFVDAVENAARRTPSEDFRDLLWGIHSILTVGGDLRQYLHGKSIGFMQDYRRRLNQFTQQLSMFVEMYITVVLVGSVFFLVLSTIMGGVGGGSAIIVVVQLMLTFVFLPMASFGFLILIKGISPTTE